MTPQLTLLHVHDSAMGYGRLGVHLHETLAAKGVTVFDGFDAPDDRADYNTRLIERDGTRSYGDTETVCWVSVPSHARGWREGQNAVIFTMWEASRLPEAFRENLHCFDTVIVPSEQNVELFSEYHPNVHLCLLGIDTGRWQYQARKPPGTRFNYLCGGSGPRKGTDLAVKAFRRVWGKDGSWPSNGPVPHLILKSPKPEDHYGERIERVGGRISADEEVDLYADAHVYVQPSRGEGFGLQPLQAIAQGLPTILTDAHGHTAFAKYGIPLSSRLVPSGYFVYGDAGDWWEPDFDELCEAMFWAYHNYGKAAEVAAQCSEAARTEFTWDRCAESFLDGVGRDRLGPYRGSGVWVPTTQKLYWTATKQDWKCDVAGTTYLFRAREARLAPADVKRMLFENDMLDPASLPDHDDGLLPEQAERLAEYQARNAHCPTCGQQLNTRPTRADELLAAGVASG